MPKENITLRQGNTAGQTDLPEKKQNGSRPKYKEVLVMVVQHNLTAMNSNRMLGLTTKAQAKSTEKLSSGYKINRAADDAAGLSISEKMRKQIRGLTQASANAQDGISAVQTAEGALTEVHDMLQRMNELAVKASNGTMSESDRTAVQNEIDQLVTEIDRVAETTKFNEIYLLKGNAEGTVSDAKVNAHDAGIAGKLVDNGNTATFTVDSKLEDGDKITIAGKEYKIGSGAAEKKVDDYVISTDATDTAAGKLGAETVGVGDSFTNAETGKTYTIVNKAANAQALFVVEKSAFTITHSDGSTESYNVSATAGAGVLNAADALDVVKQALAAGEKVTLTKDAAGKDCDIEVVEALENTGLNAEISITDTNLTATPNVKTLTDAVKAIDTGALPTAGDTVTIGGKTKTLTGAAPIAASDIEDVVNALSEGDEVMITRDGVSNTFKVGDTTDAVKNTYTVADILSNIKDGDSVQIGIAAAHTTATALAAAKGITTDTTAAGATANTVVGDAASTEGDVISKAKALEMIGEELAKASSIGTDTAATVKNNNDGTFEITKGSVEVKDSLAFNLHVGADADMTNKITVDISSMSAAGLGIKGINISDTTGTAGTYAVDAIADAVAKVSAQRSALGAVQNRLEHTINNLDNVVENTTSAESQIRDTDMATEMVRYSNNNILAQAGQAMLAQANQSNQGVLSLLG